MLIAGRGIKGIGLGTAQFAFRDGTPEDSVVTVHAALDAGVMLRTCAPLKNNAWQILVLDHLGEDLRGADGSGQEIAFCRPAELAWALSPGVMLRPPVPSGS